jgi:hypothetical protein
LFTVNSHEKRRMFKSLNPRNFRGFSEGYVPPSIDEVKGMVTVRQDLVTYIPAEELGNFWDDRGSLAYQRLTIYTGPDFVGCFGFPNYDPPSPGHYPILDRSEFNFVQAA